MTARKGHKKFTEKRSSSAPSFKPVNQEQFDLALAGNQVELEQQVKEQTKNVQSERQAYYAERRADRQRKRDQEVAKKIDEATDSVSSPIKKGISGLFNTEASNDGFRVGSLDLSWGMFFLILLFVLWFAIAKAPNHSNQSRMTVIWKAFIGQEEIVQ